jgi:hypothetical protein
LTHLPERTTLATAFPSIASQAMPWAIGLLLCGTCAVPAEPAAPPSYLNDVVPLLTKAGCNSGGCHGKGAGQNGFKLSLRGYAPDDDHDALTRDALGRRIDTAAPAESLLYTKPTGKVPHEGGKLFDAESREAGLLLQWIRAGAPRAKADESRILKLEVSPKTLTLPVGAKQPLTVHATFGDGTRRDVTWLTRFDSNDAAVSTVTPQGVVQAVGHGATAVRMAFLTEVAVVTVATPYERDIDPALYRGQNNAIDAAVMGQLRALRIDPAPASTDEEFLRRVTLDTIGTLPTAGEIREFLKNPSATKRTEVIDRLLARPEFVDTWTLFLSDLLQNRKERDHDVRGAKGVRGFHAWIRQQVAANRGWDAVAADVLRATGPSSSTPAVGYYIVTVGEHREVEKSEVAESVAQTFLGTRIGCARCHNHPLERYTQDDFYHFAAFFSRVQLQRHDSKEEPTRLELRLKTQDNKPYPAAVRQPRTSAMLAPQSLDRAKIAVAAAADPRQELVRWMTDPKNPAFAEAMVNRVWKRFLGTGLVEPVDDLRATNPPSNPELMEPLRQEFVTHGYDIKHLVRLILTSRTYQLSSATTGTNATETRFYSHYYARRLPAEVLLDALCQATGVPEKFDDGYPLGMRAVQLPDPVAHSAFLKQFGSSDRVTACACERSNEVTLPQLLSLGNGDALQEKIASPQGYLSRLLKETADPAERLERLMLATLCRKPSDAERRRFLEVARDGGPGNAEVYQDLLWALLNSKEFVFNH